MVLFHAFPDSVFKSGFVGVDVFFVISGFLISTIIFRGMNERMSGRGEGKPFSFIDFYSRRVRRIFPSLIFCLLTFLVLGWFVLLPDEYSLFGKHTLGASAYVSNLLLWSEAGDYFQTASQTKPLLHLWSLGIEEQFYLIWPLVLFIAYKLNFNIFTLALVGALASFGFELHSVKGNPTAAFYSPFLRFWELMAGSILAWLKLYKGEMFRGIAGLLKEFSLFLFAPGAVRGVPKYQPKPISKAAVALGVMMAVIGLTGTCALEVHNRKNIDSYVKDMGLETVEKEIPAGLSDLNIEMGTGNIELLPADNGKSRIVCENVVKDKLTISDGGSMKVKYSYSTTSRIASFKFGFEESFAQKTTAKIKVYLTEDQMTSIKLDNDLGEIKCSGINADKLSISCDCGDAGVPQQ